MPFKVFVVEDDKTYKTYVELQLYLQKGIEYTFFEKGQECLDALVRNPNLVVMDIQLPDISGNKLLQKIKESHPDVPTIALSGQESINITVELFKNGLYDYITKDELAIKRLNNLIQSMFKKHQLSNEIDVLKRSIQGNKSEQLLIGNSRALKTILKNIQIASEIYLPVFVHGNIGTGKDTVAELIHKTSSKKDLPFVRIPVLNYNPDLLEKEFFDFVNPSSKHNVFELAKQGSIYIDEITGLSRSLQLKLAHFFDPMNTSFVNYRNYPIKLIYSSTKDLEQEALNKNFSIELYYKIKGFTVHLPDLVERENDILLLANHFLEQLCKKNKSKKKSLHPSTIEKLKTHPFRGNITELRNLIELACSVSESPTILPEHIHFSIQDQGLMERSKTLKELNYQIIKSRLIANQHNVVATANELEISKSSIYALLKDGKI
jgi:two-component system, NtrC family, response regulator AtoC